MIVAAAAAASLVREQLVAVAVTQCLLLYMYDMYMYDMYKTKGHRTL